MRRELAHRQRIGFGGQPLQRADHQTVNCVGSEEQEDQRAAQPQRQERPDRIAKIAAGDQDCRQPHDHDCSRSDEPQLEQ